MTTRPPADAPVDKKEIIKMLANSLNGSFVDIRKGMLRFLYTHIVILRNVSIRQRRGSNAISKGLPNTLSNGPYLVSFPIQVGS